jgi:tetratricopeptide (TPR) repeat protein
LVATVYLTFSRGSWVALAVGAAVLVSVHPARVRAAVTVVGLAGVSAVAVWIGSRMPSLWKPVSSRDAVQAGHRFAAALVLLAPVGMLIPLAAARVSVEWRPRLPRRAFVAATVAAGIGAAVLAVAFAGRAYESFQTPAATTGTDLNDRRLFSASGQARADYWHVAWHDVEEHPLLGSGAGTFELRWDLERPNAFGARDAHNLYLETLAELGPIGLLLLGVLLVTPLAATMRADLSVAGSGAIAAYAAYIVHAAIDWDWEIPAVTLAALTCGAALLVASRAGGSRYRLGPTLRAAALVVVTIAAAAATVGYVSAEALKASREALARRDYPTAVRYAKRAARFAPWASDPWLAQGEAELAAGDRQAARASFRRAISKDRQDWLPWFRLASASTGSERARALEQAIRRNPHSPEAAQLLPH